MKKFFINLSIFFSIFYSNIFFAATVKIYYFERPPYYFTENGIAKGILIEKTEKIFNLAKIKYKFYSLPVKRIFAYLEKDIPACSPGWYYTEKRSKIFKYTLPIYESKPIVAVVNSDKWNYKNRFCSLKKLLLSNLKLGLISGFNYGKVLENSFYSMKKSLKLKRFTTSVDNIIKLVALGRIDYTFVSEENIYTFLNKNRRFKKFLTIVRINEIGKGEKRYIICSKKVSDKIIMKLNNAIKRLNYEK